MERRSSCKFGESIAAGLFLKFGCEVFHFLHENVTVVNDCDYCYIISYFFSHLGILPDKSVSEQSLPLTIVELWFVFQLTTYEGEGVN